jgi:hypothetical protein
VLEVLIILEEQQVALMQFLLEEEMEVVEVVMLVQLLELHSLILEDHHVI